MPRKNGDGTLEINAYKSRSHERNMEGRCDDETGRSWTAGDQFGYFPGHQEQDPYETGSFSSKQTNVWELFDLSTDFKF